MTAFRKRLDALAYPGLDRLRALIDEFDIVVRMLEKETDMAGVWPPADDATRASRP